MPSSGVADDRCIWRTPSWTMHRLHGKTNNTKLRRLWNRVTGRGLRRDVQGSCESNVTQFVDSRYGELEVV
jgi:hypothetical protein